MHSSRLFSAAVVAVLSALPGRALALDPGKAITQYVHDAWTAEQGLPQNAVQAIRQTRDGYLWLATQEGLVRFDGLAFRVFDRSGMEGLVSNDVRAICETPDGALWIGTWGGGLVRLIGGKATVFTVREGLPNDFVNAVEADVRGWLWIGTNGGLARMPLGTPGTFAAVRALAGQTVRCILPDGGGGVLAGSFGGGLFRVDANLEAKEERSIPPGGATALFRDGGGSLWVGTPREGLLHLTGGRVERTPAGEVDAISSDRHGNIWAATTRGLLRVRGGSVATFTAADGLGDSFVWAVTEDREGSVWVGTSVAGLHRFKEGKFTPLTAREGLSGDYVRVVLPARDGSLWIGTYGSGLSHVTGTQIARVGAREGLANDNVRSIAEDRAGAIWAGTMTGLSRIAKGGVTSFDERHGLLSPFVWSVFCDSRGDLWIGPNGGGLHRFRGADPKKMDTWKEPIHQTVRCMAEDRAGRLWLGTYGDGLYTFDGTAFTRLSRADGLADDAVFALHEDAEGTLWIGTNGGLTRLKDGKATSFTRKDGLFSDTIFQIVEDRFANLWMTCNNGIFRVSRKDLDAFAANQIAHLACVVYGRSDGLLSTECNGGFPAGSRLPDGRLAFPTIRGVAFIDPLRIALDTRAPSVMVDSVLADGHALPVAGHLVVGPGLSRLRFDYSSLTLLWPDGVRYRYRLEGFESDWVEAGRSRTAEYTNLPPGEYVFHVLARNHDGFWNERGATVQIEVRPRVYQTWWFQAAALALVAGLAFSGHRLRLRQAIARARALQALVDAKTAQLRDANAELGDANRYLEELSTHDPLTGLLNRRSLDRLIATEWRRCARNARPLAVIMLDVDHFKAFNDAHGHPAGDECLRRVAKAIGVAKRAGDALVRYGGEEFTTILPETDGAGALVVAERMRAAVEALEEPRVTVSLGVAAVVPKPAGNPQELVEVADHALYLAKSQGRNRVVAKG